MPSKRFSRPATRARAARGPGGCSNSAGGPSTLSRGSPCWGPSSPITFWFVGLLGAGTLVNLLETGLFGQGMSPVGDPCDGCDPAVPAHPSAVGRRGSDRDSPDADARHRHRASLVAHGRDAGVHARSAPHADAEDLPLHPRSPGRAVRDHHDGPRLRFRDRPADRGDLLPPLQPARGFGLPAPPGRDGERSLSADRAQRPRRPADGPRPRMRHDGHPDDTDPRNAQAAPDRDAPAGARSPLLGAAGRDPRHDEHRLAARDGDLARRGGGRHDRRGMARVAGSSADSRPTSCSRFRRSGGPSSETSS